MSLKKTLKSTFILSTLCVTSLVGCGQVATTTKGTNNLSTYELDNFKEGNSSKRLQNDGKIVIGFSMDSLKEYTWQRHKEEFEKKAAELGAITRVEQANSNDNSQLSQIDKLIAEGVNVLVVEPHDGSICSAAVEKAHKAGIKVISYDRLITNSDVDYYVSVDNYQIGVLQAEEMLKKVPSGNIGYIGGSETDNNAILFRKGAMDVLEKHRSSINVVLDKYSPNWDAQEAYKNTLALLDKGTNVQGIICANDGVAGGTIAALEKFKLDKTVPVTGLDSELSACQRIVEGTQLMSVYKPVDKIADKAVELAISLAKGETPNTTESIFNGKKDVPSYYLQPISITKENMMDTIIKDKCYELEDVYKNIPESQRPKN